MFSSHSSRPPSARSDRPPVLTLADLSPSLSDNNNELPNERLNSSYSLPTVPLIRSSSSLSDSNRRSQRSNHNGGEVGTLEASCYHFIQSGVAQIQCHCRRKPELN